MPLVSPADRVTAPRWRGSAIAVSWPQVPRRRNGCISAAPRGAGPSTWKPSRRSRSKAAAVLSVRRFFDFSPLDQPRKHLLVAYLDPHQLLERALGKGLAQARRRRAARARHLLDARLDLGRPRGDPLGPGAGPKAPR